MEKKKDENQIQLDMGNAIDNKKSKLAQKEKLIEVSKMMTGNDSSSSLKAARDLIDYFK